MAEKLRTRHITKPCSMLTKKKESRHMNFYPEEEEEDASKLTKYVCWTLNNSYTQAHIFIKSHGHDLMDKQKKEKISHTSSKQLRTRTISKALATSRKKERKQEKQRVTEAVIPITI